MRIDDAALESRLATALQRGTWMAVGVIAIGLAVPLLHSWSAGLGSDFGDRVVAAGVALLILLPVVRVGLMLFAFVGQRDYLFGAIAGLVLCTMLIGLLLGLI